MNFIQETIKYFQENPTWFVVLLFSLVAVCGIAIVLFCLSRKHSTEGNEQQINNDEPQQPNQIENEMVAEIENTPVVEEECIEETEVIEEEITLPTEEQKTTENAVIENVKEDPVAKKERKSTRYNGKWIITKIITKENPDTVVDEAYFFELRASNGEKLFSSEEYTSFNGAVNGIETHKNNILKGNFRIGYSKKGEYIFKLLSGKNTLLCTGENYATKIRCEKAIESTKRFAETAVLDENLQEIILTAPADDDVPPAINVNGNGKWIVSKVITDENEELFFFELFASNGEKLLGSEEYTSYNGALSGIETHKNNIEKDNFRISLTKRGDYIFKLLNGNGQLLSLGEHYKTKSRCASAVDSVKRFAKTSPIVNATNE